MRASEGFHLCFVLPASGLSWPQVAAFIGAASDREVVFTRNATEAINLVAQTWGLSNLKEGDEVFLTKRGFGRSELQGNLLFVQYHLLTLLVGWCPLVGLLMQNLSLGCLQIVLSVAEHHGNLVPWQMLAQRTGAVLRHAELTSTQEVDVEVQSTASRAAVLLSHLCHGRHS